MLLYSLSYHLLFHINEHFLNLSIRRRRLKSGKIRATPSVDHVLYVKSEEQTCSLVKHERLGDWNIGICFFDPRYVCQIDVLRFFRSFVEHNCSRGSTIRLSKHVRRFLVFSASRDTYTDSPNSPVISFCIVNRLFQESCCNYHNLGNHLTWLSIETVSIR